MLSVQFCIKFSLYQLLWFKNQLEFNWIILKILRQKPYPGCQEVFSLAGTQGTKAVKAKYKICKRKQTEALNTLSSVVYFLRNLLVYRKMFMDDYPSGYFQRTGTMGW